ncbi:YueI family protein [Metabacillus herbersteinensis]|uniref:YueI family protein n=1 Tax=Metabacillus herbersteinensis TaxID=283816 RepID=A0ABV6GBD8_9BACI
MSEENINSYINQGVYGPLETKPDERNKFLGTIRERIVVALTVGQVRQKKIYKEVETELKRVHTGKLLLNGSIDYSSLSKYVKIANQLDYPFSIISDFDQDTSIGLVLASSKAVDRIDIYIQDEIYKK